MESKSTGSFNAVQSNQKLLEGCQKMSIQDDKINQVKSSSLNTAKLDDAMQELLDICQFYDTNNDSSKCFASSKKLTEGHLQRHSNHSNDNTDNHFQFSSTGESNIRKQLIIKNKCDKTNDIMNDDSSIEKLQQKQTELQFQLDEVLRVSKKLEAKQKRHKLKCIIEDEDNVDGANDQNNEEDDNELIEFQQIENELKISELNRQLDNIQEELRIRLYKRLLSNTNSNRTHQKQPAISSEKFCPNNDRGGSQTDESSPTSSTCSDEQTTTTSTMGSVSITRSEAVVVDGPEVKQSKEQNQNEHYQEVPLSDSTSSNPNEPTSIQPISFPPASSMRNNSSINSDLERIEESDREEEEEDFYLNSDHFHSVLERRSSPVPFKKTKSPEGNYKSPRSLQHQSDDSWQFISLVSNNDHSEDCIDANNGFNSLPPITAPQITTSNVKKNRPLTLYLPKPDELINLVDHVQALGHDLNILSNDLKLDTDTARGYLYKSCSKKSKRWLKRYFVFNRSKKVLEYYHNENQLVKSKPNSVIPFEEICDVYVDHKLSVMASEKDKSSSSLTGSKKKRINYVFVLSALNRKYLLSTSKAELMRAWIDILFTAARANDYLEEPNNVGQLNNGNEHHSVEVSQANCPEIA